MGTNLMASKQSNTRRDVEGTPASFFVCSSPIELWLEGRKQRTRSSSHRSRGLADGAFVAHLECDESGARTDAVGGAVAYTPNALRHNPCKRLGSVADLR